MTGEAVNRGKLGKVDPGAPASAPSAEARRLIDETMETWSSLTWATRVKIESVGEEAYTAHVNEREAEHDAAEDALLAYVAGLEAEVARLRGSGPNDRIDRRTRGDLGDDDAPYLDEVVISNALIHIEQMTEASYWIGVYRGEDEWRFWINANAAGGVDLACTDRPDATQRGRAAEGGES